MFCVLLNRGKTPYLWSREGERLHQERHGSRASFQQPAERRRPERGFAPAFPVSSRHCSPTALIALLFHVLSHACQPAGLGCSAFGPCSGPAWLAIIFFFNKVKIIYMDNNPHHFHSYFLINVIELPYCLYTTFRQRYLLGLNQSLSQCTPTLHE